MEEIVSCFFLLCFVSDEDCREKYWGRLVGVDSCVLS